MRQWGDWEGMSRQTCIAMVTNGKAIHVAIPYQARDVMFTVSLCFSWQPADSTDYITVSSFAEITVY